MRETEYPIQSGDIRLAGSLVAPEAGEPVPLVIFAHGSGPLDRDQNTMGQKLNVFNTIAHHISPMGVASYRYDKRGNGKSTGSYHAAGHFDLFGDLQAVTEHFAAQKDRFSKIIILGHSEGTLLGASLADKMPIDGLILLAPFVENLRKILLDQGQRTEDFINELSGFTKFLARIGFALVGSPLKQQQKVIERATSTDKDTIRVMLTKFPAKWLRETMALEPLDFYQGLKVPTLIIGGAKDIQCNPNDVGKIADIMGDHAETHLLPNLTHLLRNDPEPASFAHYPALLKQPMEVEVLNLIATWLGNQIS